MCSVSLLLFCEHLTENIIECYFHVFNHLDRNYHTKLYLCEGVKFENATIYTNKPGSLPDIHVCLYTFWHVHKSTFIL